MSNSINIGYEKKVNDRFLPNGLREHHKNYLPWLNQHDQYRERFCANPLLTLLSNYNVKINEDTVSNYLVKNIHFYYLIEILNSNNTWLHDKCINEFSPWPSISQESIHSINTGKGTLLITHLKKHSSNIKNNPFSYEVLGQLHYMLNKFNISTNRVVYLTPILELGNWYDHFCEVKKIKSKIKIVYLDYFELGWNSYFRYYKNQNEIFTLKDALELKSTKRLKYFTCFNREPRVHRKLNLAWLKETHHFDKGFVSFYNTAEALQWESEDFYYEKFKSFLSLFQNSNFNFPLTVDAPKEGFHISFSKKWTYEQSYFSIVTERMSHNLENWNLLTAKIYKTISNLHPFVVIAPKNYLSSLRKQGYKTFSPYIDESYDHEENPIKRLEMAWGEINKLCNLSINEIHQWYYNLLPILEFNLNHFNQRTRSIDDHFFNELRTNI